MERSGVSPHGCTDWKRWTRVQWSWSLHVGPIDRTEQLAYPGSLLTRDFSFLNRYSKYPCCCSGVFACMCVWVRLCAWRPARPAKGVRSSGTGVTAGRERPRVCLEWNLGHLEGQSLLLTAQSSRWPLSSLLRSLTLFTQAILRFLGPDDPPASVRTANSKPATSKPATRNVTLGSIFSSL